ncbi:MAG TPA: hypothetical protein VH413_10870 [Verrucomicrobiae bacterium]|jgi:hypothetical protein|nr:hypothetical protein [Verrucomicrobiae bacterium]
MNKIIEYAVVVASVHNHWEMGDAVNEKIKQGFQPYGHPCASGATSKNSDGDDESDFIIVQAMVKYESGKGNVGAMVG